MPFDALHCRLVRQTPKTHRQVPAGPEVPSPELLPHVWELLNEDVRTTSPQPLRNRADVLSPSLSCAFPQRTTNLR